MTQHCCARMDFDLGQRCEQHPDRFDCADALVFHCDDDNTYGLIIHDGGASFSRIEFCPWCGTRLSGHQERTESTGDRSSRGE